MKPQHLWSLRRCWQAQRGRRSDCAWLRPTGGDFPVSPASCASALTECVPRAVSGASLSSDASGPAGGGNAAHGGGGDAKAHPGTSILQARALEGPAQVSNASGPAQGPASAPSAVSTVKTSLGRRRDTAAAATAAVAPGLMSVLGAMAGVARGIGNTGLGQATFGLQALARRHEQERVQDHPEGRLLPPGPDTEAEAERLLDALELAHGAYRRTAAALAATTCLRAQHIHMFRPEGGRLQPAYYLAVDHPGRRVVWGVRGTRAFADLLTDLSMAAHPLATGAAHWGMTHAAHWLLQQEAHRAAALLRSLRPAGAYRLELVGHSMGGAVAALAAVMLRERLVESARAAAIPAERISCVAFAPPAVMSPELAGLCRPYVTSVVLNKDIVPRFNAASMAVLQEELQEVDWYGELQRTVMEHTLVKSVSSTLEALAPTPITPPAALPPPSVRPAAPDPSPSPTDQPPVAAAAAAVQQLSAALLESAALKAALQALDDWKAKAVAVAGEPAEAMVRRQADIIRSWLKEVAAGNQQEHEGEGTAGNGNSGVGAAPGEVVSGASDSIKLTAEAAAERLRVSLDAAMASLTAAAAASRHRLTASLTSVPSLPSLPPLPSLPLPSLPSLPQAHELPLIEPDTAAEAATVQAAAAASAQKAAVGSDADAMLQHGAVGHAVARLHDKGLPMMLPPGRILYICPRDELDDTASQSAPFEPRMASRPEGTGQQGARVSYAFVELPAGQGFKRLLLGRAALVEHQCRAYRRVLMQLARRL